VSRRQRERPRWCLTRIFKPRTPMAVLHHFVARDSRRCPCLFLIPAKSLLPANLRITVTELRRIGRSSRHVPPTRTGPEQESTFRGIPLSLPKQTDPDIATASGQLRKVEPLSPLSRNWIPSMFWFITTRLAARTGVPIRRRNPPSKGSAAKPFTHRQDPVEIEPLQTKNPPFGN